MILQNSSTLSVGNATAFRSSTNVHQHTTSQVLRNSTMLINATKARRYTTSPVLRNSTVLINTTDTWQYKSSQDLKNLTGLINTANMQQHTVSQGNSAVLMNSTNIPHHTYSMDSQSTRLNTSSLDTTIQESTSKKFSRQTDSMLSQLQTLNTGVLYTSGSNGSKLQNVTLAPTQFFITSSIRHTIAATDLSTVESIKSFSNHINSPSTTKSFGTTTPTPSNTVQLANESYYVSPDRNSAPGRSANRETTLPTSTLSFALVSINTSPIKATSVPSASQN